MSSASSNGDAKVGVMEPVLCRILGCIVLGHQNTLVLPYISFSLELLLSSSHYSATFIMLRLHHADSALIPGSNSAMKKRSLIRSLYDAVRHTYNTLAVTDHPICTTHQRKYH
jgi:hypothetical protein